MSDNPIGSDVLSETSWLILAALVDLRSAIRNIGHKVDAMSQTQQQAFQVLLDQLRADEAIDEAAHAAVTAKLAALTAQNTDLAAQLKAALDAAASNGVSEAQLADLRDIIGKFETSDASLTAGLGADPAPASTGALTGGSATLGGGTPTA